MDNKDLLKVKSEIVCWGIRLDPTSEKLFLKQNPHLDNRTGNAGLGFKLGHLIINAQFGHNFTKKSPYTIKNIDGKWFVCKEDQQYEIIPNKAPNWYLEKTSKGTPLTKLIIEEGNNMLVSNVYDTCCYFSKKEQCKFCGINKSHHFVKKDPKDLAEAISIAVKEKNYGILWTGGNTYTPDRGALNYLEPIKELRKLVNNPVICEMAPPEDNKYLDILLKAGVNNFDFNIEIWNDNLRKQICPGKSNISKSRYFEVWKHCLEKIGNSSMETALIAGLEPLESVKQSIEELTSKGVIPTAIPFHPNDDSTFSNKPPCDPKILREISLLISKAIKKYGLQPKKHLSCLSCGACTIEVDMV